MADSIDTLPALGLAPPAPPHTRPAPRPANAGRLAPRRRRRLGPGKQLTYGGLLGPVLALLIWSATSAAGILDPRILPAPWTVAQTGAHLWSTGTLPLDVLASLSRAA